MGLVTVTAAGPVAGAAVPGSSTPIAADVVEQSVQNVQKFVQSPISAAQEAAAPALAAATGSDRIHTAHGMTSPDRIYTQGVDFSQPVNVVVRLHGDGAGEYYHTPSTLDPVANVAARHNAILVAPLTTDWGTHTWWRNGDANVDWLASLVNDVIMPEFGIDASRVTWMGYSGGAEVITRNLIPRYPHLVSGGAVMLGGGGRPYNVDEGWIRSVAGQVGPLSWVTGTADNGTRLGQSWDALGASYAGAAYYRDRGYVVNATFPEGVDHFGLNQPLILDNTLNAYR